MAARYAKGLCALAAGAALGIAGCAPYELLPQPTPTGNTDTGTGTGPGTASPGSTAPTTRTSPTAQAYTWGLPPSDTSVAGNDGPAYAALQQGCAEGQAYLDAVAPDGYGFRSPLNVVLFAAGLRLCTGDIPGAGTLYAYGVDRYGLSGLPEGKPECELYKSVRSVLEQEPRTSFPCPGGVPPINPEGPTGLFDDPLTMDVDESVPLDTETTSPGSETAASGTTEATEATDKTDATDAVESTDAAAPDTGEIATPTP